MTVVTTRSPASAPRSCIAIAHAASTWSPSITLPRASANSARSASPSCATPASAPSRTTSAATTSGWSAPQPTLMLSPSGRSNRSRARRRRAGAAGGARAPTPRRSRSRPRPTCRRAIPRPRPPGGRGSARARSPFSAHPAGLASPARRFGQHRLDLVLELVGQLRAVAREELDAVVLGRVVRRGDHDARRRVELGREERDRRGGLDPGQDHVAARRTDAVRRAPPPARSRSDACRAPPRTSGGQCRAVPARRRPHGPDRRRARASARCPRRRAPRPCRRVVPRGKATRARSSGAPEPGACGSIGP